MQGKTASAIVLILPSVSCSFKAPISVLLFVSFFCLPFGMEFKKCFVLSFASTLFSPQIKAFVFEQLSSYVASQISSSIDGLKESLLGTLKRCLQSLEENVISDEALAAGYVLKCRFSHTSLSTLCS